MIGKVQLIQLAGCKQSPVNRTPDTSYSIYAQERDVVYIPHAQAISLSHPSNHSQNEDPNAYSFSKRLEIKNHYNTSKQKDNIEKITFHSKAKCNITPLVNQASGFSKNYYYNGR